MANDTQNNTHKERFSLKEWLLDRRDDILDFFDDVRDWWDDLSDSKRHSIIGIGVMIVVLAAILIVFGVTHGFQGISSAFSSDKSEEAQEEVYVPAGADDPIEQTGVVSATDAEDLGFDAQRAYRDEEAIREFCNIAFNFSSQEEYVSAHNKLMETYKGYDKWQFNTEFMSAERIDERYALMFMQVEAYVSNVDGDVYEYTCDATIRTRSPNQGQATGHVLMTVMTDAQGNFKDVKAYSVADVS